MTKQREIKRKYNTKPNRTSFKMGHKKIGGFRKGDKHTKEAKEKLRQSLLGKTGSKARNWKGGITDLTRCIHSLDKYKQWRMKVFLRDNFTCQFCGARSHVGLGKSVYLEPHHIKSLKEIIKDNKIKNSADAIKCKELWDINNGITLCKECHKLTDTYAGKNL